MKQFLKQSGIVTAAIAMCFAVSCNNSKTTTTSTTDSTSNATSAMADTSTHATDTSAAKTNANPDASFVIDAAKSNSQEIQMLEAGAEQGSNKKLKTDAKKMLADHQKLNDQMTAYAAKKNIMLSSDTVMDMSAMNSENEATFDTAWTSKMMQGHQQTIAKFQAALNTVTDPELKTMITNTLPTLQKHLEMCQTLMTELKK